MPQSINVPSVTTGTPDIKEKMKSYKDLKGNLLSIAEFIRSKGYVKTHELDDWKVYTNQPTTRQQRDARVLAERGYVKRLDKSEKEKKFGEIKEDVWYWVSDYSTFDFQPTFESTGQLRFI